VIIAPEATEVAVVPDAVRESVVEVVAAEPSTTRFTAVLEVCEPDVPVMVTCDKPGETELPAVNVMMLSVEVELGLKVVVTPLGSPLAVSATAPEKPLAGVSVTMEFAELPGIKESRVGAAVRAKVGVLMVSWKLVEAVVAPEVPVIVTFAGPWAALLLAVSVMMLLVVVGLGEMVAVTPLGRPEAASVTAPVNPY